MTPTTQSTHQSTSESQLAEETVTDVQLKHPVCSLANCTSPNASIDVLKTDDQDILLTFSFKSDAERFMTSLTCYVHLKSPPSSVISAVLLEHSVCSAGGVFVLLWDNTTRTSWDVCSAWGTLGPAFVTSSNAADISVELSDVLYTFDLNISVGTIDKPLERQLELLFISATEGNLLILLIYMSLFLLVSPTLSSFPCCVLKTYNAWIIRILVALRF